MKLLFTLGVPLHELGHYLVCKILLLKVTKAKFLPNFKDPNQIGFVQFIPHRGVLGAVTNMLVGIAPLLLGAAVLYVIYNREPNLNVGLLQHLGVGIVSVIIMQSMIPSWQDIKISLIGLSIIVVAASAVYFTYPTLWSYFAALDLVGGLDLINPYLSLLTLYQASAILVITLFSKIKK